MTGPPLETVSTGSIIRRERTPLAGIVALTLLATVAEAGFLVLVTRVGLALSEGRDTVGIVSDQTLSTSTALSIALAAVALRFVATTGSAALTSRELARLALDLRSRLIFAFLGSSWPHKQSLAPGRVLQIISSYTQTAATTLTAMTRLTTAAISMCGLLAFAFVVQPNVTLLVIGLVGLLALAMVPLRRRVGRVTAAAADAQLVFAATVAEMEDLSLEIEINGVRTEAGATTTMAAGDAADTLRRSHFAQATISPAYQLVAYGTILGLLAIGSTTGVDDIGTLGAVMLLLLRSLSYGQSVQVARAQLVSSTVYLDAIEDELRALHRSSSDDRTLVPESPDVIVSDGLTFSYDGDGDALSDITFSITPGEIIGVVGPSGSGKSTLTELLLGLRPSHGRLTVGGVPVDRTDRMWWARHVALVPQHSRLISGSAADNVRFLRPEISDADIEAACRAAGIHDDIAALGRGYDTHVGERGSALSGGQRQRLCIARALAGQPRLLVLDEPTSALDEDAEQTVLATLARLRVRTTIVIVTHRPAALDICDRVLRLRDGHVASFGPPVDLTDGSLERARF